METICSHYCQAATPLPHASAHNQFLQQSPMRQSQSVPVEASRDDSLPHKSLTPITRRMVHIEERRQSHLNVSAVRKPPGSSADRTSTVRFSPSFIQATDYLQPPLDEASIHYLHFKKTSVTPSASVCRPCAVCGQPYHVSAAHAHASVPYLRQSLPSFLAPD